MDCFEFIENSDHFGFWDGVEVELGDSLIIYKKNLQLRCLLFAQSELEDPNVDCYNLELWDSVSNSATQKIKNNKIYYVYEAV